MKKIIACLLLFCIAVSICGCGGNNNVTDAGNEISSEGPLTTLDVCGYASVGRIPELEVGIGGLMGDVRAQFTGDSLSYAVQSNMHTLSCESVTYYMTTGDYKVVAILASGKVFEFKNNPTPDELVAFLGEPVTSGVPDLAKFDPYSNVSGDKWSQTYTMGENTLVFYYLQGELYTTLLYKTGGFALLGE